MKHSAEKTITLLKPIVVIAKLAPSNRFARMNLRQTLFGPIAKLCADQKVFRVVSLNLAHHYHKDSWILTNPDRIFQGLFTHI
jgi:hypothetical protein